MKLKIMLFSTVWKFHNFSVTQILCEINFWDYRMAKSTILSHLENEMLNFEFYEFFHILKAEIDQKSKLIVSKIAKNGIFNSFRISKIDFT